MASGGGFLANAISGEVMKRGFTIVNATTVSSLSKFNLRKIDAHILVEVTNGYDGNPNKASVNIKSAKTGQVIVGLLWQNGRGCKIGSPCDRDMRKDAIEAAEEIVEAILKEIPSPSAPYAEITNKPDPPSLPKEPSSPSQQPPKSKNVAIATGTGFLFGSQDYIVTNYHVVKGTSEVTVKFTNGESINATVVGRDTQNDVAVLKLTKSPSFQSRAMKFGDSSMVRMGDEVFTIGYPSTGIMGINPKYTKGVISAVTGIKDNPTVFQTTVPIQPGNSGGPLFNDKGEVVGLTTASLSLLAIESMGAIPQSVNYAVKSSFVKNTISTIPEALLSNRGIVVVPTDSNSRSDFIEAISKNVVLIMGKVD